ncbi:MAG: hypothetical protein JSS72_12065 [Armatimonadetes bacterium]|nr:hypothetical protein [Armatimonadota bacterium]
MRRLFDPAIVGPALGSRLLISVCLLVAFTGKIVALDRFISTVHSLKVLPPEMIVPLVLIILALELAIATGLLWKRTLALASAAALGLFAVFCAYALYRIVAHVTVPCYCFGPLFRLEPKYQLLASGVYFLIATRCFEKVANSRISTSPASA